MYNKFYTIDIENSVEYTTFKKQEYTDDNR